MINSEPKQIEKRSEFSLLMREAQEAKQEGDWFLVKYFQLQMTNLVEKLKQQGE